MSPGVLGNVSNTGISSSSSNDWTKQKDAENEPPTEVGDDVKKATTIQRQCMCNLGQACHGMSAAFAVMNDKRGKFVRIPAEEYVKYCGYLHKPKNSNNNNSTTETQILVAKEEEYFYVAAHHFDPGTQWVGQEGDLLRLPAVIQMWDEEALPSYNFNKAHVDLSTAMRQRITQMQQGLSQKRELRKSRRKDMLEKATKKMNESKKRASARGVLMPLGQGAVPQPRQAAPPPSSTTATSWKIEMKPTFETAQEGEMESFLDAEEAPPAAIETQEGFEVKLMEEGQSDVNQSRSVPPPVVGIAADPPVNYSTTPTASGSRSIPVVVETVDSESMDAPAPVLAPATRHKEPRTKPVVNPFESASSSSPAPLISNSFAASPAAASTPNPFGETSSGDAAAAAAALGVVDLPTPDAASDANKKEEKVTFKTAAVSVVDEPAAVKDAQEVDPTTGQMARSIFRPEADSKVFSPTQEKPEESGWKNVGRAPPESLVAEPPPQPAGLGGFQEEEQPLDDIRKLLRNSNVVVQPSDQSSSNLESVEQRVTDFDLVDVSSTANDERSLDSKPRMIFVSQAESENAARGELEVEASICYHNNPRNIAIFYGCMMALALGNLQYGRVWEERRMAEMALEESAPIVEMTEPTSAPWSANAAEGGDEVDPMADIDVDVLAPETTDNVDSDGDAVGLETSAENEGEQSLQEADERAGTTKRSWFWPSSSPTSSPDNSAEVGSDALPDDGSIDPETEKASADESTGSDVAASERAAESPSEGTVNAPKKSWFGFSSSSPEGDALDKDDAPEVEDGGDSSNELNIEDSSESALEKGLSDEGASAEPQMAPKLSWFWPKSSASSVSPEAYSADEEADVVDSNVEIEAQASAGEVASLNEDDAVDRGVEDRTAQSEDSGNDVPSEAAAGGEETKPSWFWPKTPTANTPERGLPGGDSADMNGGSDESGDGEAPAAANVGAGNAGDDTSGISSTDIEAKDVAERGVAGGEKVIDSAPTQRGETSSKSWFGWISLGETEVADAIEKEGAKTGGDRDVTMDADMSASGRGAETTDDLEVDNNSEPPAEASVAADDVGNITAQEEVKPQKKSWLSWGSADTSEGHEEDQERKEPNDVQEQTEAPESEGGMTEGADEDLGIEESSTISAAKAGAAEESQPQLSGMNSMVEDALSDAHAEAPPPEQPKEQQPSWLWRKVVGSSSGDSGASREYEMELSESPTQAEDADAALSVDADDQPLEGDELKPSVSAERSSLGHETDEKATSTETEQAGDDRSDLVSEEGDIHGETPQDMGTETKKSWFSSWSSAAKTEGSIDADGGADESQSPLNEAEEPVLSEMAGADSTEQAFEMENPDRQYQSGIEDAATEQAAQNLEYRVENDPEGNDEDTGQPPATSEQIDENVVTEPQVEGERDQFAPERDENAETIGSAISDTRGGIAADSEVHENTETSSSWWDYFSGSKNHSPSTSPVEKTQAEPLAVDANADMLESQPGSTAESRETVMSIEEQEGLEDAEVSGDDGVETAPEEEVNTNATTSDFPSQLPSWQRMFTPSSMDANEVLTDDATYEDPNLNEERSLRGLSSDALTEEQAMDPEGQLAADEAGENRGERQLLTAEAGFSSTNDALENEDGASAGAWTLRGSLKSFTSSATSYIYPASETDQPGTGQQHDTGEEYSASIAGEDGPGGDSEADATQDAQDQPESGLKNFERASPDEGDDDLLDFDSVDTDTRELSEADAEEEVGASLLVGGPTPTNDATTKTEEGSWQWANRLRKAVNLESEKPEDETPGREVAVEEGAEVVQEELSVDEQAEKSPPTDESEEQEMVIDEAETTILDPNGGADTVRGAPSLEDETKEGPVDEETGTDEKVGEPTAETSPFTAKEIQQATVEEAGDDDELSAEKAVDELQEKGEVEGPIVSASEESKPEESPQGTSVKAKTIMKHAIVRWYNSGFALESVLLVSGDRKSVV